MHFINQIHRFFPLENPAKMVCRAVGASGTTWHSSAPARRGSALLHPHGVFREMLPPIPSRIPHSSGVFVVGETVLSSSCLSSRLPEHSWPLPLRAAGVMTTQSSGVGRRTGPPGAPRSFGWCPAAQGAQETSHHTKVAPQCPWLEKHPPPGSRGEPAFSRTLFHPSTCKGRGGRCRTAQRGQGDKARASVIVPSGTSKGTRGGRGGAWPVHLPQGVTD